MNRFSYEWLAGLIDGDGCFTISIRIDKRTNTISISPHLFVGLKGKDSWVIKYIFEETGIGHIYYSNKGKEHEMCKWEVLSYSQLIPIIDKLLPHLVLKKNKAELFKQTIINYFKTEVSLEDKHNGIRHYNSDIKEAVHNSLLLNPDRQSIRYRNKKDWSWWEQKIDEMYPK